MSTTHAELAAQQETIIQMIAGSSTALKEARNFPALSGCGSRAAATSSRWYRHRGIWQPVQP